MLYKWATKYCPNVKYVLKTDDDVFVDTFHLPRFLKTHQFDEKQDFFLCMVLKGFLPRRNVDDKWFVTKEEFSGDEYPPYCAGPVYVTKIKTMKKILLKVEKLSYLFIDDVLLTGIAAKGVTTHYDWSDSFLEHHTDSTSELLSTTNTFYTPQLLAAMNLNSTSILQLQRKARNCYNHPKCYKSLNQVPVDSMRPKKVTTNSESFKIEL